MISRLFTLFLVCLPILAGATVPAPAYIDGATTITTEELFQLRHDPEMVLIDVRREEDYNKGHIPGAINILSTKMSKYHLRDVATRRNVPVVFYCQGPTCRRAAEAAKVAVKEHYKKVYYYFGGIQDWTLQGYQLEK